MDSKWTGLSIDILMKCCEDEKWDEDGIMINVLNNHEIMNEGKLEFVDMFNHYRDMCINTKFELLFDFDSCSVMKSFILLKKQMIKYIMIHIVDYYDEETNEITTKKLKIFKKKLFYFCDKQINMNKDYIQIKRLWNVSVAELRSEAIVESICSVIKKIYTPDRARLKQITLEILLQLRLSLPLRKKERDLVIKKVIERYH